MPGPLSQGVLRSREIVDVLFLLFSWRDVYWVLRMWGLALALFVTWVLTNDHDASVATNDLALIADFLDAGVYLHDVSFSLSSYPRAGGGRYFAVAQAGRGLLVAIDNASAGEVVGTQLYDDLVLGEDSDVVLAHLARNVGKNLMAVGQLHAEHGVGQRFDNRAFDLDDAVFLGHSLTSLRCLFWSCAPAGLRA